MLNSTTLSRLGATPGRFFFRALPVGALTVALGAAGPWGCEKKPGPASAATTSAAVPAESYTVRGVIERLPEADKPSSYLHIHHEAIPSFKSGGKVVGMAEMAMPFPVGTGVSLEGLQVGDRVEFTFEVQEKPRLDYHVTRITKLPPDTPLNLKIAIPAPAPSDTSDAGR